MNGPLLGFKFGAWEGGPRVPFIVRWPGRVPAGSTSNALISHIDLMATLAALVRQSLGENEGPDSYNLLSALIDSRPDRVRESLVLAVLRLTHLDIRHGKWVYIGARGSGGFRGRKGNRYERGGPGALLLTGEVNSDIEEGRLKAGAPPGQLYDLESDHRVSTCIIGILSGSKR